MADAAWNRADYASRNSFMQRRKLANPVLATTFSHNRRPGYRQPCRCAYALQQPTRQISSETSYWSEFQLKPTNSGTHSHTRVAAPGTVSTLGTSPAG